MALPTDHRPARGKQRSLTRREATVLQLQVVDWLLHILREVPMRPFRLAIAGFLSLIVLPFLAPKAAAQDKSVWSVGASAGVAVPLGGWSSELEQGQEYRLSLSHGRLGSRWTITAELATHPFDFADEALAARNDGSVRGYIRQTSLGLGMRYAMVERPALSTWLSGGVAVHSVRTSLWRDARSTGPVMLQDEWAPGLNAGFGVALGPFRLKPVAEVGLRFVALRERPLLSIPIAVGLRF